MTREQKLEAALRIARQALQDNLTEIIWLKEMQQIDAALATSPTSEWNEAIEAAVDECERHSRSRESIYDMVKGMGAKDCAAAIRALKRKEK